MNSSAYNELGVLHLNLRSEKTYRVINYILKKREFSQKEICEKTRVSKGWVSHTVNWLLEQRFVKKSNSKYALVNAAIIFSLFPLFRKMNKNLMESFSLNVDPKRVFKEIAKRKVVFCGTTALQYYSGYFKDPSINVYSNDKKLFQELKTEIPGGLTKINVYKPDLCLEIDIEKKKGINLTNAVRTIIDLFCDDKAYTAKELIEKTYGERIG